MVQGAGLLIRWARKGLAGSNPALSATNVTACRKVGANRALGKTPQRGVSTPAFVLRGSSEVERLLEEQRDAGSIPALGTSCRLVQREYAWL